jgi:hypothetical protein
MQGLRDYQQAEECLKERHESGKWVILRWAYKKRTAL